MSEIHTVTLGGKQHEIKMTMGMLNELARVIGDVENVAEVSFNQDLREACLNTLLAKRDSDGNITKPLAMFNLDMSPDATLELLDWAGSHVTDFLLKSLTNAKTMMDSRKGVFQSLAPTSTGGEA